MPKDIREPATEMSAPPSAEWESADPYPLLAAARRRGAVSTRSPFGDASRDDGAIHVLGYDEALAVLRDAETYPSGHLGDAIGPMFKNTIMAMDEPEHSLHRALVSPVFRPKLLAHWQESFIRGVIDDLIDTIVADGRADLVESLTFAFPVRVIADILGLPKEDVARFKEWADDLVNIFYALDRGLVALSEFEAYFSPLVAERRARPQDDLISFLVTSEVDGQRLSDDAVLSFIRLLLPAGIESTYRSLGNLLVALLTHPEQLEAVRRDPGLRTAAIEEGLRWETPFLMVLRQCARDTLLSGVEMGAGQFVYVYLSSANHDERRYLDPDVFDIHRRPAAHLAFGAGSHVCLGMHLTRLETRVALDALLERLPLLRLDPDEPRPHIKTKAVFRSPETIPVLL